MRDVYPGRPRPFISHAKLAALGTLRQQTRSPVSARNSSRRLCKTEEDHFGQCTVLSFRPRVPGYVRLEEETIADPGWMKKKEEKKKRRFAEVCSSV